MPAAARPSLTRKLVYSFLSIWMGLWTFRKVNSISGPAFEPILEVCTNPSIPLSDFASMTGYHAYEPRAGLGIGIFRILVCLITQFLFELVDVETHPAGLFVWCCTILPSIVTCLMVNIEAGRTHIDIDANAHRLSLVRYPIVFGLVGQLLGISVVVPLLWIPSYILFGQHGNGHGHGPLSTYRLQSLIPSILPIYVLTLLVFTVPTDSYTWTVAAGILGGPIVALVPSIFWIDPKRNTLQPTKEDGIRTVNGIKQTMKYLVPIQALSWNILLFITMRHYNTIGALWDGIWIHAGPSVRFMTVDAIILFTALILWVSFHNEILAVRAFLLSMLLGPGAGPMMVLGDIEQMKFATFGYHDDDDDDDLKKKN